MSHSPFYPFAMLYGMFTQSSRRTRTMWFALSLAIAVLYGILAMGQAFAGDYVVQDDVRQHVFWMQRFIDPELFPDDVIADYFQGVAPFGYTWLYQFWTALGISPFLVSKLLPFFLGLLTAGYCYWIVLELFPIPFAGFIASVSLSQSVWYSSEISSATPRAFLYPLFLAFIYYLIREKSGLVLLSITLQALFYPQIALVCLGVLGCQLVVWQAGKLTYSKNSKAYWQLVLSFGIVAAILLYTKSQADFGDVVTRAEAIAMPEFQPNGRHAYFGRGSFDYWLNGRSGIFHLRTFTPATLVAGFLLPGLLWIPFKSHFREIVTPKIKILVQILLASFVLFLFAHLVLFQLHLPSRYTSHSLRIIAALACGISWIIIGDDLSYLFRSVSSKGGTKAPGNPTSIFDAQRRKIFVVLAALLSLFVVLYPALFFDTFPKVGYYDFSNQEKLYKYFAAQPKDSVIGSISVETSNIPTFSARSVLVSSEHALAYHKGYYRQLRQRAEDLIQAQYATEPAPLLKATKTYGIDFWLIDKGAFQPTYISNNDWLMQYQPMANDAIALLEQGRQPVLQQAIPLCELASADEWAVLDADCVYTFAEKLSDRPSKPS